VRVEGEAVISVDNACALGSEKFLSKSRLTSPILRDGGAWKPTGFEEAVRYAATILGNAERPLLFGWSGTSAEAQCIGIHIAEEIRGVIDNCSSICHGPSIMGIQEAGHPGCSLGVVKNRADVVIYWGSNPIESHPRHLSRYTTFVNGKYRDNGSLDRTLVVVDIRKTDTAKIADEFIRIKPGGDYAVFSALRAILRGHADLLPLSVGGVPRERLIRLADLCRNARFGALFTGIGLTQSPGRYKNVKFMAVGGTLESDRDGAKNELDAFIKENGLEQKVIFTGNRSDIPELLAITDIFTLPSYREGMPRSLIEAMCMSKPAVATNIRGCREEVEEGVTGFLIPVGDHKSLAEKIMFYVENPEKRQTMGIHARKKAEKEFDEKKVIVRQLEVIKKLTNEKIEKK